MVVTVDAAEPNSLGIGSCHSEEVSAGNYDPRVLNLLITAFLSAAELHAPAPFTPNLSDMVREGPSQVNAATRLTKDARETPSVPHVGMPAKR